MPPGGDPSLELLQCHHHGDEQSATGALATPDTTRHDFSRLVSPTPTCRPCPRQPRRADPAPVNSDVPSLPHSIPTCRFASTRSFTDYPCPIPPPPTIRVFSIHPVPGLLVSCPPASTADYAYRAGPSPTTRLDPLHLHLASSPTCRVATRQSASNPTSRPRSAHITSSPTCHIRSAPHRLRLPQPSRICPSRHVADSPPPPTSTQPRQPVSPHDVEPWGLNCF
jgi:hypothetical protein